MPETFRLTATDGVSIGAYKAMPPRTPKGGIVVIQEIFGVNPHIRRVADGFAAEGYLAIAPAVFDRVEPAIELDYTPDGMQSGRKLAGQLDEDQALFDIQAAIEAAKEGGAVGVVGFCWGGTMAYAAAARLDGLSAAVGYYGGGIEKMLDRKPRVPLMLHFGEQDAHIPMTGVETIRAALPGVPVYTYPAGHGFNCDARGSYDKVSAAKAMTRTLAFLDQHLSH